jgi:putative flavoprotein involved in K+ transport
VAASGSTVVLADGTGTDVEAVVWATGFRAEWGWLAIDGAIADGAPVHTRGVSPVAGLYFLGLPWQHTRGSALLGFVGEDAAWLAGRIAATSVPEAVPAAR